MEVQAKALEETRVQIVDEMEQAKEEQKKQLEEVE